MGSASRFPGNSCMVDGDRDADGDGDGAGDGIRMEMGMKTWLRWKQGWGPVTTVPPEPSRFPSSTPCLFLWVQQQHMGKHSTPAGPLLGRQDGCPPVAFNAIIPQIQALKLAFMDHKIYYYRSLQPPAQLCGCRQRSPPAPSHS